MWRTPSSWQPYGSSESPAAPSSPYTSYTGHIRSPKKSAFQSRTSSKRLHPALNQTNCTALMEGAAGVTSSLREAGQGKQNKNGSSFHNLIIIGWDVWSAFSDAGCHHIRHKNQIIYDRRLTRCPRHRRSYGFRWAVRGPACSCPFFPPVHQLRVSLCFYLSSWPYWCFWGIPRFLPPQWHWGLHIPLLPQCRTSRKIHGNWDVQGRQNTKTTRQW